MVSAVYYTLFKLSCTRWNRRSRNYHLHKVHNTRTRIHSQFIRRCGLHPVNVPSPMKERNKGIWDPMANSLGLLCICSMIWLCFHKLRAQIYLINAVNKRIHSQKIGIPQGANTAPVVSFRISVLNAALNPQLSNPYGREKKPAKNFVIYFIFDDRIVIVIDHLPFLRL